MSYFKNHLASKAVVHHPFLTAATIVGLIAITVALDSGLRSKIVIKFFRRGEDPMEG